MRSVSPSALVVALGVTVTGERRVLGVMQTATENQTLRTLIGAAD